MLAPCRLLCVTCLGCLMLAGCGESEKDKVNLFHSGARAFGPLQWAQDKFSKELKQVVDGQPSNPETMKANIAELEKAIAERRDRLKQMNPPPAGQSAKPLLESCEKHLEVSEKTWLPEMKEILAQMEKKDGDTLVRLQILNAMKKCKEAENQAQKDLQEKFDAFEKEYAGQLKK